jgi:hypothetical protein
MTDHRSGYTDADFDPIVTGKRPLPNFERMEPGDLLNAIAAGGGLECSGVHWAKIDDHANWARYFFSRTQGGVRDGSGYAVVYASGKRPDGTFGSMGFGGRFVICRHVKVAAPGANPTRGWHPGHCEKCGLDMTVDSSD